MKQIIDKKIADSMYRDGHLYLEQGEYWKRKYGFKAVKVPMNANFTCPNWDGRLSNEGCIYCPDFARQFTYNSFRRVINKDIKEQVEDQIKHYKEMSHCKKALVYIAFGTNTYRPVNELKKIFNSAIDHKDVIGLSIGTRPDCLPDKVFDLLGSYVKDGYEIWLEIGQQTVHYHTLETINRKHGFAESIRVVDEAHNRGIFVLFFNILGLPYETPGEMIETARILSVLGADAVKIYPLIVMRGTRIGSEYLKGNYRPLGFTEYIEIVVNFLEHLSPYVIIQRLSKDCGLETKLAPKWNTYRLIVGPRVEKELKRRGTKQGSKFKVTLSEEELKPLRSPLKTGFKSVD